MLLCVLPHKSSGRVQQAEGSFQWCWMRPQLIWLLSRKGKEKMFLLVNWGDQEQREIWQAGHKKTLWHLGSIAILRSVNHFLRNGTLVLRRRNKSSVPTCLQHLQAQLCSKLHLHTLKPSVTQPPTAGIHLPPHVTLPRRNEAFYFK